MMVSDIQSIAGVILSGGQGSRMGSLDKGLQSYRDRPLIAHVIARFAAQVDDLLVSANRNIAQYEQFGYPVVEDDTPGFAGPLAGIQSALRRSHHALLATVPCDAPHLPLDLVKRLRAPLLNESLDLAIARTIDRAHPVFCVLRKRLLPHLEHYLDDGGRKFQSWYQLLRFVEVSFDDQPEAFANLNTLQDLGDK